MVLLLPVLHRTRRHPSRRVRLLARDHAQHSKRQRCMAVRSSVKNLERTVGIEPTSKAWKLSYYRCTTPAHSLACLNQVTASKIVSPGHQLRRQRVPSAEEKKHPADSHQHQQKRGWFGRRHHKEFLYLTGVGKRDRKSTRLNSSHTVISYAV